MKKIAISFALIAMAMSAANANSLAAKCNKGDIPSCEKYATILTKMAHNFKGTQGVPDDKLDAEAFKYAKKAVDGGSTKFLTWVAGAYKLGMYGLKPNKKKAIELYKKACRIEQVPDACPYGR